MNEKETRIALLVVFNHRYDKNISRVEALYKDRFSYVYHIMPFYDGEKENVIPVFASSYHFESYIAQAYQHIKDKGYTHFLIVADDMILNPSINEKNIFDKMGVGQQQSYIYDIREIYDCFFVQHVEQMRRYRVSVKGVEVGNILPSREEAERCFLSHGLHVGPLTTTYLFKALYYAYKNRMLRKTLKFTCDIITHNVKISYPLVWAYSDILLLSAETMTKFSLYCGAFAATGLFVEYAIPTSLIFAADDIITDKQLKMHGIIQIYPKNRLGKVNNPQMLNGYLPRYEEEEKIINKYHFNLSRLLEEFDEEILFIHPIKLSKWHE